MRKAMIAGGLFATALVLLAFILVAGAGQRRIETEVEPGADSFAATASTTRTKAEAHRGLLYGRVTTAGGATFEGRLRWGGDEEPLWGNYFNGYKKVNPWVAYVPPELLPREHRAIEILGVEILGRERLVDLGRPFMARFGDITRIESRGGRDLRVTLKSGTVFHLDRFSADDFDDGLRVWDSPSGVVDLDPRLIRTIELSPSVAPGATSEPIHGTVHTRHGDFTGAVEWDRRDYLLDDRLDGFNNDGELLSLRFDTLGSIARKSAERSLVTLLDGSEIELSGTSEVGQGNHGMYVDDRRYGRVLIGWDAFERFDLGPPASGPAYGDFPPGRQLAGRVVTRSGRSFTGRLVYDLDESETTETLDAPSQNVNYTIPFGLVASIVLPVGEERGSRFARVTLHSGEELQLERTGDLGEKNAGMLIFDQGQQQPAFLPWKDVAQVDFDRPEVMYPGE